MTGYFFRAILCLPLAVLFAFPDASNAAVTIQHLGLTDPATEGFTLYMGTQLGGTDTLPYWEITHTSTAAAQYKYPVGGWDDPSGWTATVVAKVVSGSPGGISTVIGEVAQVSAELLDTSDRWDIHLIDGTGEGDDYIPMGMYVMDADSLLVQLASVDVMQYHTYQAIYDPAGDGGSGLATYYLDGSSVGTRTRAEAMDATIDWAAFGSSAITAETGTTSRWNEFTFETGQHPREAPENIPGDANRDGVVDDDDATTLASNWLGAGGWSQGDFNGDGIVNDMDATLMATNWQTGAATASVPEPGLISLMLAALASLVVVRFPR